MQPHRTARIDRSTGEVVNVEMAHQAWIDAQDDPDFLFVACPTDAGIGSLFDAVAGTFAAPDPGPE